MLTGAIALPHGFRTCTSDQRADLGQVAYDKQGRVFRYVQAGASVLVAGNWLQSPAVITTHQGMAVAAAAAVGATSVTVTLGATNAVTANQYAGGYLSIQDVAGYGYLYRISSHPAADAAASLVVTLDSADSIQVALTTSSIADLSPCKYKAVIQGPASTMTGVPVGVAVYPITATYYGWVQTGGEANVYVEGTPAVGTLVAAPGDTAGQVTAFTGVLAPVGIVARIGVDEKWTVVDLRID